MKRIFTLLAFGLFCHLSHAQTKITHSSSNNIWTGGSATCSSSGVPYANHFMRRFDLSEFPEIVDTIFYVGVEYGVESTSGGAYDVLLYIYDLSGDFLFANMAVDEWVVSAVYPDSSNYRKMAPFTTGFALPTDTLVVDLYTPLGGTATFYPGSNPLFESDSSYISASTCAIYEPTTFGTIGFPSCHLVLHLYGNQKPIAGMTAVSTFKDEDLVFVHDDFLTAFVDPDAPDTINAIRVLNLPAHGTLKLSGIAVNINDVILSTQFDSLLYTPDAGYFGSDSFDYRVKDNYHWSNNTNSASIDVMNWVLSINETEVNYGIYPNPTNGIVHLLSSNEISAISLLDERGRLLQKFPRNTTTLDLSNFPSGVYYIQILSGEEVVNQKLMKQ